ncbi:MAG TPA: quinolinate synthase NadA [Hungateiclostridium thermocellum]|jgi:quinolinate synthase|uniref:Quinolinate synthase n=2 Tax=Acetivibrio thermocellus TaxID=1515 RepID=A3DHX9_ACET2|nr:quinolinate synthase NadA [Acetivibrio thermocellus]CDG36879.1 Quinolinate synthase A [Acetivibrio thermocellus BC1]ABN53558.1 quinolinate synthetase complex, A subunit [Acetivibrio thermocellus ATCC 27405]ADU75997.1 quinolinate synthetase complex, A subunit [Acetivibrio thermocellus DSM 1313]ALX10032.1 Quinolinate synthase A [Acetivibrio thermocellus AD2]ANV77806.1 Quinolinate synthase A [Acetivibrio thermocellus DSM 2360]
MLDRNELKERIKQLKEEKNAVIVAHNYQNDEVQEIADVIGDSLALSRYCANNDKDVIVFCGVHFMAESAKILSPSKTVLLAEIDAGCPMADMITADALREAKKKYPGAVVVCYVNSSAEVKAESDICCTSSNAVEVVKSIPEKDILFVPDKNLGSYVAEKVPEKNIILWEGYCITHHRISVEQVREIKKIHPDALVLVHPECRKEVCEEADFVGSTKQIIDFAEKSEHSKFIIGTEMGVLYKLKRDNPDKTFYLLSQGLICPNMKKTTLESVYNALKEMKYEIKLDENIRLKAKKALDRMIRIG